jgi:hypothetical protein
MSDLVKIRYAPISEPRRRLLAELERIVGSETYNSNIQNWGPGGVFMGEGRGFRYPVTLVNESTQKSKVHSQISPETSSKEIRSAYYAFGANELHIGLALLKVLNYLEKNYGLNVESGPRRESER